MTQLRVNKASVTTACSTIAPITNKTAPKPLFLLDSSSPSADLLNDRITTSKYNHRLITNYLLFFFFKELKNRWHRNCKK